ncbi:PilC/PilY family type IV pilus protein, partial [Klebsiella pneumoniae]|nr:PilC/PilY family type IV pilus protein [Klebsiella pneumoniae]
GSGGKGLFAINATTPGNLANKSTAAAQVLWEVNGANTDIGYIHGEVESGPINYNGVTTWVAVVGNGYYSDSNKAQLLLIDMSNGRVLKTI